MKRIVIVTMILSSIFFLDGCGEDDPELVQMAKHSVAEQAKQNERLIEQSRQMTEASKELVKADAQARDKMISAHATLQQEIQANRGQLDSQREQLEQERREIAQQRYRDPLIAQAITFFGITIACLLPLGLAAYVLYISNNAQADTSSVNEILLTEITASNPRLLPSPHNQSRVEHRRQSESEESL